MVEIHSPNGPGGPEYQAVKQKRTAVAIGPWSNETAVYDMASFFLTANSMEMMEILSKSGLRSKTADQRTARDRDKRPRAISTRTAKALDSKSSLVQHAVESNRPGTFSHSTCE